MGKTVSARTIETAKPQTAPYTIPIGKGLVLLVNPNGSKLWRFRYRFNGKAKMLSLGKYPDIFLAAATNARDEARQLVAAGIDPSAKRQEDKVARQEAPANTFESVAMEWLARQTDKAASTQAKSRWLLQFAIDAFGQKPIDEITPRQVLEVCRKQEQEGKLETASRIKVKCGQVFRYAVSKDLISGDPTRDLRGQLKTPQVTHRAAITDPDKIGRLLCDIDSYRGHLTTMCALRLAPLVFIRPGELRAAKWADINFYTAQWSYTPPKTRNQTRLEHIVPLSRQAVTILREIHALTGSGTYVFPCLVDMKKCMSENTINGALRRMGYTSAEMCGHGFRAMARTILEEVLGYRIEVIEQQLAHAVRDVHGRAYNRTRNLQERTEMMQRWSDYLDTLKTETNAT